MSLTAGQRTLLTNALNGPVTVVGDQKIRVAEHLIFRKWVTFEGHLTTSITLTLTDAGRKVIEKDKGPVYHRPSRVRGGV